QHEGLGVVEEDALRAGPDRGGELAPEVDVVERLELREAPHLADAALVVERPGRGDADQIAGSGDGVGGVADRVGQLGPARVGPERDPGDRARHGSGCEIDSRGRDVAAAEVQGRNLAHGFTNALITFGGGPLRRRRRYVPTAAGTTTVSAYASDAG